MHPLRRAVGHHRLKLDAEEALIESSLRYTILQPMRYMQHLALIWNKVLETGIHAMPFNIDVKFNVADLRDLAEATAIVVTNPGHLYTTYELAGPEKLSQRDMAAVISRVLGKEIRAEALSLEEVEKNARADGASKDRVTQMLTMNQHYDQFGFRGNPNVLRWILGREPNKFQDYVTRLAASSVAG